MKIKSGKYKGRNINVPKSAKPPKSIVANSIFSTLGDFIVNSTCLDLFAGSGYFGIESLSRGAKHCDFVEIDSQSVKTLKSNLESLNLFQKSAVNRLDALKFIGSAETTYDLIFVDPPFNFPSAHLLKILEYCLKKDSIVVYHYPCKNYFKLPNTLKGIKEKRFGRSCIYYIKPA